MANDFQLDNSPLQVRNRPTTNYLHLDKTPLHFRSMQKLGYGSKQRMADDFKKALRELHKAQAEADWQDNKPGRIESIAHAMYPQIQLHMTNWVEKVDAALTDAKEPPAKNATFYFVVALAGNLLWAATSLPSLQGMKTLVVVMSGVGATVGSGTVEKIRDHFSSEEGRKGFLRERISEFQGEVQEKYLGLRYKWADEFDNLRIEGRTVDEALDVFLWKKMFTIEYAPDKNKTRYFKVYINAKANIEKLLGRFRDEWDEWVEGNKLINLGDGMGPNIHIKKPSYKERFEPNLEPVWRDFQNEIDRQPLA
jgi:hypothetical protein